MESMKAFAMGAANQDKEPMVFDWDKAAKLIKETQPETASAGLFGDWEWTGGEIYADGDTTDDYTFLRSTWATPELEMDGVTQDCYKMQSEVPEWDEETKWPDSSLEILNA